MNVNEFVRIAVIMLATSWIGYSLEAVTPMHPMVRRSLQGTLALAAAIYLLRALQVFS